MHHLPFSIIDTPLRTDAAATADLRLRAMLDASNDSLILWDGRERLVLRNRMATVHLPDFGQAIEIGADMRAFVERLADFEMGLDLADRATWIERRLARMRNPRGDIEHRLRTGAWVLVRERRTLDGGVLQTLTDITEVKEREARIAEALEEVRRISQAKSDFLAHMSHELRTPLNAIIGFAEMIRDLRLGADALDRYREYAEDIRHSGEILLDTINDILDLSKIEAGYMRLQIGQVDALDLMEQAARPIRERATAAGLAFTVTPSARPLRFLGDRRALRQVLLNLLSNAVKFTPPDGEIALRAIEEEGGLAFEVADTGIGMDPEDLPKAFAVFSQLAPPVDGGMRGTGIGLALAKALVELHGGRIDVTTARGRGTRMRVRLPLAPPGSAPDRVGRLAA